MTWSPKSHDCGKANDRNSHGGVPLSETLTFCSPQDRRTEPEDEEQEEDDEEEEEDEEDDDLSEDDELLDPVNHHVLDSANSSRCPTCVNFW